MGSKPIRHPSGADYCPPFLFTFQLRGNNFPGDPWLCDRSLPGSFFYSLLQGLPFHQIVAAGGHTETVLELDETGVSLATGKNLTGSHISFRKTSLHAPDVSGHAHSSLNPTIEKSESTRNYLKVY